MTSIAEALIYGRQQGLDPLDVDVLLAKVLDKNRAWLLTWPEKQLTSDQWQHFQGWVQRRKVGEPVAYLTGEREFWSLPIQVNPSTLIPRPDTETLVAAVLERFDQQPLKLVDLGSGTGAIALALKTERPHWHIYATDKMAGACQLAQRNAQALTLPIQVIQSHWCDALADNSVNLIVSNPPYIDADDAALKQPDLTFEPTSALVAANQGLADIEQIVQQAKRVLTPQGWLFIEHGWQQGTLLRQLLQAHGYWQIATLRDAGQRERVTYAALWELL